MTTLDRCSTCEHSLAPARGLELPQHPPRHHYSTRMGNHEKTLWGFAGWDVILSRPLEPDEIEVAIDKWNDGDYRMETFVESLPADVEVIFKTVHLVQE